MRKKTLFVTESVMVSIIKILWECLQKIAKLEEEIKTLNQNSNRWSTEVQCLQQFGLVQRLCPSNGFAMKEERYA